MAKISVIIPTHNRCDLLKNAIDSVLNQTYKDFELIIIDDASTDDTEKYINSINSDKISYIKNRISVGGSQARNIGMENANGEYIAFLDDDDEWIYNKLEKQIALFEKDKELGLIYTGVKLKYEDHNITYNTIPSLRGYVFNKILIKNYIGVTPSVMIKKEVINKAGNFDKSLPARQDYDFWIRICKYYKIDYVKEPLVISYVRSSINRISSDVISYEKAIEIINKKYEKDISKLSSEIQKIRKSENYFFLGSQAVKANNSKIARKYFIKTFKSRSNFKNLMVMIVSFFGTKAIVYARKLKNSRE